MGKLSGQATSPGLESNWSLVLLHPTYFPRDQRPLKRTHPTNMSQWLCHRWVKSTVRSEDSWTISTKEKAGLGSLRTIRLPPHRYQHQRLRRSKSSSWLNNCTDPWVEQILLLLPPQVWEAQRTRSKGKGRSRRSPSDSTGRKDRAAPRAVWFQASGQSPHSSCYFLGFSRMLRNFPRVISLDSSSPSW